MFDLPRWREMLLSTVPDMTIHHPELIELWLASATYGGTLTFYNDPMPIEDYAQRSAAFMRVYEELKRAADAKRIELTALKDGRHQAIYLDRACSTWCGDDCEYPNCGAYFSD